MDFKAIEEPQILTKAWQFSGHFATVYNLSRVMFLGLQNDPIGSPGINSKDGLFVIKPTSDTSKSFRNPTALGYSTYQQQGGGGIAL